MQTQRRMRLNFYFILCECVQLWAHCGWAGNGTRASKSTLRETGHHPLKHRNSKFLKAQNLCGFFTFHHWQSEYPPKSVGWWHHTLTLRRPQVPLSCWLAVIGLLQGFVAKQQTGDHASLIHSLNYCSTAFPGLLNHKTQKTRGMRLHIMC